jgi:hypothetical protein
MKEKILAALGFPPPALLQRITSPWGNSIDASTDVKVIDARDVKDEASLKNIFKQLQQQVAAPISQHCCAGFRPKAYR